MNDKKGKARFMLLPTRRTMSFVEQLQRESSNIARSIFPYAHISITKNIQRSIFVETKGYFKRLVELDQELTRLWFEHARFLHQPEARIVTDWVGAPETIEEIQTKCKTSRLPLYYRFDLKFPGDSWPTYLNHVQETIFRYDFETFITPRIYECPHLTIGYYYKPYHSFEMEDLYPFFEKRKPRFIELERAAIVQQAGFCERNIPLQHLRGSRYRQLLKNALELAS